MKIALVGTAVGEMEAPFEDETFEIWSLNWNTNKYSRSTRDFEIHTTRKPVETAGETITQENFPHQWVADNLPRYLREGFFKSSVDYMLAYALYLHKTKEKVEILSVHGVHMAMNDDEYFKQQPSLHAWTGYCLNHFDIVFDDHSPLMKSTYMYGVDDHSIMDDSIFSEDQLLSMANAQRDAVKGVDKQIAGMRERAQAHGGTAQAFELMAKAARARKAGQKINSLSEIVKVAE